MAEDWRIPTQWSMKSLSVVGAPTAEPDEIKGSLAVEEMVRIIRVVEKSVDLQM